MGYLFIFQRYRKPFQYATDRIYSVSYRGNIHDRIPSEPNLRDKNRCVYVRERVFLGKLYRSVRHRNQTVQKLYTSYAPQKSAAEYTFYSFVFTAAALIVAKLIIHIGSSEKPKNKNMLKNNFGYILVMSISLFGASFFQTLAEARIEAIILYPLLSALSLIAGSTMASLFFKEKLKKDCIIGIVLVLCALIFSKI